MRSYGGPWRGKIETGICPGFGQNLGSKMCFRQNLGWDPLCVLGDLYYMSHFDKSRGSSFKELFIIDCVRNPKVRLPHDLLHNMRRVGHLYHERWDVRCVGHLFIIIVLLQDCCKSRSFIDLKCRSKGVCPGRTGCRHCHKQQGPWVRLTISLPEVNVKTYYKCNFWECVRINPEVWRPHHFLHNIYQKNIWEFCTVLNLDRVRKCDVTKRWICEIMGVMGRGAEHRKNRPFAKTEPRVAICGWDMGTFNSNYLRPMLRSSRLRGLISRRL